MEGLGRGVMKVYINGKETDIEPTQSLNDIVKGIIGDMRWYAVLVNGEIVAKDNYSDYFLKEDDRIDIVTPFAGG